MAFFYLHWIFICTWLRPVRCNYWYPICACPLHDISKGLSLISSIFFCCLCPKSKTRNKDIAKREYYLYPLNYKLIKCFIWICPTSDPVPLITGLVSRAIHVTDSVWWTGERGQSNESISLKRTASDAASSQLQTLWVTLGGIPISVICKLKLFCEFSKQTQDKATSA